MIRNLLFGFNGRVVIGEVTVDASVNEIHTIEAEVTRHPVEEGAAITDHYRPKPRVFQIEGIVSHTSIEGGFPGKTFVNSVKSLIAGSDPVNDAWQELSSYFKNSTIINVTTPRETYQNMLATSLSSTRDSRSGNVLRFSMTVEQVRIVQVQTTGAIKFPDLSDERGDRAVGAKEGGAATDGRKPAAEATPAKKTSLLKQGVSGIGAFFR